MYHSICQQLTDSNFRETDNRFPCCFYNNLFLRNNCHNILHDFFMRKCIARTELFFSDSIQSGILLIPYHPHSSSMQRFKFLQILCDHQCSHIRDIHVPASFLFMNFSCCKSSNTLSRFLPELAFPVYHNTLSNPIITPFHLHLNFPSQFEVHMVLESNVLHNSLSLSGLLF